MTPRSELADIEWLTGSEAGAILAELAEDAGPIHTVADRLRKALSPARSHLVLEQVELRRRAAAKFTHAQQIFFTRTGLEQATDEWVARYKAERFGKYGRVADLCCGIGGDLMALSRCVNVSGIDRDPVCAHFARVNSGSSVRVIDVGETNFDAVDAWHIDPDRRATGRRTTSPEHFEPNLATVAQMLSHQAHAAVKLAPATKPPAEWIEHCELEWISRDGECKQLVAWHGDLATSRGQRRATILSSIAGKPIRTIIGLPNQQPRLVTRPDRYVYDVDPAVIAARLNGAIAAQQGLSALGTGPTYLTGAQRRNDGALACFEVMEVIPMRARTLAQYLQSRSIGQLEIKTRGVDIDPEKLRRDLKLRGANHATLLITPVAGRPTAIVARRVT
jgi:hypothetical protein